MTLTKTLLDQTIGAIPETLDEDAFHAAKEDRKSVV